MSLEHVAAQAAISGYKLSAFLHEIVEECEANRDSIPPEPATAPYLFEGQLSNSEQDRVRHCPYRLGRLQLQCTLPRHSAKYVTGSQ